MRSALPILICVCFLSCEQSSDIAEVQQWSTHEIILTAAKSYSNGYTDVEVWAEFNNDKGLRMIRPAFWDGGKIWKIRFAPPDKGSTWRWVSFSNAGDDGLDGKQGSLQSVANNGTNRLLHRGLLKMSPGRRNVVHADGTPFLVVGDTPWSIPFRATPEGVKYYADDRKRKGFNTALLMSLQPDRYAEGPESRDSIGGYARAFDDLRDGHLNQLRPDYFQHLDTLIGILIDHEIVPVYQPVFHGFGWKGKTVLGPTADPEEYSRYCRYLVARYGSMPAFWLVSADGTGRYTSVKAGGETIEKWDAYTQPAGIHYNPADNYLAEWAQGDSTMAFHYNRTHQSEPWLDFQWAQTGHGGEHLTYKVEQMYDNEPTKAVLNGEPTYEGMNGGQNGLGWWQGEEAWTQLMHGGTMGVVYGAASLWQWKLAPDEPGWDTWTDQPLSWREAIDLEGSKYVGLVSKAFEGFDFTDMEKRRDLTEGNKPLLAKEKTFYISYLREGGAIRINGVPADLPRYWFNPRNGEFSEAATNDAGTLFTAPDDQPWVLIIGHRNNPDTAL